MVTLVSNFLFYFFVCSALPIGYSCIITIARVRSRLNSCVCSWLRQKYVSISKQIWMHIWLSAYLYIVMYVWNAGIIASNYRYIPSESSITRVTNCLKTFGRIGPHDLVTLRTASFEWFPLRALPVLINFSVQCIILLYQIV